ncbi:MAG: glycosyltransferase family 2 protein [Floccifex sp.]
MAAEINRCSVSIIIVNYNSLSLVKKCILSIIQTASPINYEIIVVDNNSEDIHELQQLCDNIIVIQLNENLGFGRANNKGVDYSSGEYLFFLNPDTYFLNHAHEILYEEIKKNKSIGICGGNLYDDSLKPIHSYNDISLSFKYISKLMFTPPKIFRDIKRQHNFSMKNKQVGYITGADLMIKRDVFERCGRFPNNIFMYYEDVYLCYRVKRAGLKIVSVPNAKIVHLEGQSMERNVEKDKRKKEMSLTGQKVFLQENHSKIYSFSLLTYSLVALYLRLGIMRMFGLNTNKLRDSIKDYKQLLTLYNE